MIKIDSCKLLFVFLKANYSKFLFPQLQVALCLVAVANVLAAPAAPPTINKPFSIFPFYPISDNNIADGQGMAQGPESRRTDLSGSQLVQRNIYLYIPSGNNAINGGRKIQLRKKRSAPLYGDNGIVLSDGTNQQASKPGDTIVLEGSSGYILSNGQNIPKLSQRSIDAFPGIGIDGHIFYFDSVQY